MSDLRALPEDWIDILPDAIPVGSHDDDRTLPGDIIVFEWRVENGRRVPGAWITLNSTPMALTRRHCSWNGIFGEELLTPDQRQAFLRGEAPRLEWGVQFDCPVTLRLEPDFDLTIEGLERVKKTGFEARWSPERLTIRDLRPELMLRAGALPSVNYRKGHDDAVNGPTSAEIDRAGVESAYTRDPSRSADKHASAILPDEVGAVSRFEVLRAEKRSVAKRDPHRAGRTERKAA